MTHFSGKDSWCVQVLPKLTDGNESRSPVAGSYPLPMLVITFSNFRVSSAPTGPLVVQVLLSTLKSAAENATLDLAAGGQKVS